jgi:hypothetical protein
VSAELYTVIRTLGARIAELERTVQAHVEALASERKDFDRRLVEARDATGRAVTERIGAQARVDELEAELERERKKKK